VLMPWREPAWAAWAAWAESRHQRKPTSLLAICHRENKLPKHHQFYVTTESSGFLFRSVLLLPLVHAFAATFFRLRRPTTSDEPQNGLVRIQRVFSTIPFTEYHLSIVTTINYHQTPMDPNKSVVKELGFTLLADSGNPIAE
jgi:hypothetical protein